MNIDQNYMQRNKPLKRGTKRMKRSPLKKVSAKKKPKPRDPIKTWRNKCDGLLTPLIKVRDPVCLFNGYKNCTYHTQVAHHHLKKSVSSACRYYLPNLIGLCTFCHCRLHKSEILWTGRVVKIMGMDWLADLEEQKKKEVRTTLGYYKEQYEILIQL